MESTRRKIVAQMKAKGLSQRGLARSAGIQHAQLCRYLNGKAGVTPATVDKICAALGMVREERIYVPRPARREGPGPGSVKRTRATGGQVAVARKGRRMTMNETMKRDLAKRAAEAEVIKALEARGKSGDTSAYREAQRRAEFFRRRWSIGHLHPRVAAKV